MFYNDIQPFAAFNVLSRRAEFRQLLAGFANPRMVPGAPGSGFRFYTVVLVKGFSFLIDLRTAGLFQPAKARTKISLWCPKASMHKLLAAVLVIAPVVAQEKTKKPQTLKEVLLEQLHTTDDEKDWFVSLKVAVEGLTPEQAKWRDPQGNHSIGMLVNHLAFWNGRVLQKFKGENPAP